MAKRRLRKYRKTALEYTKAGVTMGVGAYALGQTDPTGSAAGARTAVGKLAGFMPTAATVQGAGMVLGGLSDMHKAARTRNTTMAKKKRKKKKK